MQIIIVLEHLLDEQDEQMLIADFPLDSQVYRILLFDHYP
jgi:hypothetical protein